MESRKRSVTALTDRFPRNGRAAGVEFVCNAQVLPDADDTVHVARANKLVALSAGAFGSPAILERSGIGRKDVLERNGIEQKVDLPMVGENYNGEYVTFVNCVSSSRTSNSEP